MANPLDLGLLDSLSVIFSMLLVFAIVYGVLAKSKVFGDNNGLHAIVGLVSALFLAFSPGVSQVIMTMVPWFVMMFIFFLLLLQFFSFMGVNENFLLENLKKDKSIVTWVMIISFVILISSLGSVYFSGDSDSVANLDEDGFEPAGDVGDTGSGALFATLFHPKVLGAIIVLLLGTFTIMMLTSTGSVKKS